MEVGSVFHRRGQRYEIVDEQPHYTQDDRSILLWRVRSHCADCGREFEFLTTKARARGNELNRRCPRHHSPGVPVDARPARAGRSLVNRPTSHELVRTGTDG
jgi:hypothetical protein